MLSFEVKRVLLEVRTAYYQMATILVIFLALMFALARAGERTWDIFVYFLSLFCFATAPPSILVIFKLNRIRKLMFIMFCGIIIYRVGCILTTTVHVGL